MRRPHALTKYVFFGVGLMLLLGGCSSGSDQDGTSDGPTDDPPDEPVNETLVDTLNALGIDTTDTPRLDDRGNPYPDSYAPLGTVVAMRVFEDAAEPDGERLEMGRAEELLLAGFRLDARPGVMTVVDDLTSGSVSNGQTTSEILFARNREELPTMVERNTGGNLASGPRVVQGTRRDATAGDFSGNGFRSTAVAYAVDYSDGTSEIRLLVTDAKAPAPTVTETAVPVDPAMFPINDLRVASGDFDGDQKDEIAIVIAREPRDGVLDTPVRLYVVDDASTGYVLWRTFDPALDSALASPLITLSIAAARLDHEIDSELVLVVNENVEGSLENGFATRYLVLKSGPTGLSVLSSGPIAALIDEQEHVAVVADVATGDLDGDSVDEIVFAGLEEVVANCASHDSSVDGLKHVLVGLGNRYNDFAQVGAAASAFRLPGCDDANPTVLRFTHTNLLDFDGDGDLDIQVNHLVLDGFPAGAWTAAPLAQLPQGVVIASQDPAAWYDRSNSTMAVSDQTGDAVADIVTLLMDQNEPFLKVWTCDPDPDNGRCNVSRAAIVALWPDDLDTTPSNNPANDTSHVNPIIVPVDVDNDDVVMLRYTNEHRLDFTEPIVLAVLAAPPCEFGIGQNTDACATAWGSATSATAERTYKVTVSGSASFGIGAAGAGGSFKRKGKLSFEASHEWSKSYELTRSLSFTTGPLEDSVVFTAVPIDRYSYETITSTDPAELGVRYSIDLPRSVIQLIAERNFYNANIQPDALHIDERVFTHVPGRVSSYPTASEKDATLLRERSRLSDARYTLFDPLLSMFDPVEALGGMETGPISVGQGSGATELGLEYVETYGQGNALELAFEFESETAYGALVGWSVGLAGERTLSISHGDSTTYAGTIGSIDSAHFADNRYEFGLFVYLQALDGQEFEVVNFWVDQER